MDFYKRFYDNAPIAFYQTSIKDGTFLKANNYCAKLLGFNTPEELVNKKASDFYVSPRDKLIRTLKEKGEVSDYEILLSVNNQKIWVSATAKIYPEKGYLEGSLMDITERKLLEEEIIDLKSDQFKKIQDLDKIIKTQLMKYS